jgi:hypothetical protein
MTSSAAAPDFRPFFRAEAQALINLEHQNIPRLLHSGVSSGRRLPGRRGKTI